MLRLWICEPVGPALGAPNNARAACVLLPSSPTSPSLGPQEATTPGGAGDPAVHAPVYLKGPISYGVELWARHNQRGASRSPTPAVRGSPVARICARLAADPSVCLLTTPATVSIPRLPRRRARPFTERAKHGGGS